MYYDVNLFHSPGSICKFLMKVTPGAEWGMYQVQIYSSLVFCFFLLLIKVQLVLVTLYLLLFDLGA